jgi:hypothetical protein
MTRLDILSSEKHSKLTRLKNYDHKMFKDIGPGNNVIKPFTAIIYDF